MEIRNYSPADLDDVVAIFRSNVPKYFGPGEESELRDFLSNLSGPYFVAEIDEMVIGAGGIALNKDERSVSLCWGMIHSDHLGKGLGRELTGYRIAAAREEYGRLPLVISTSQHTAGFYGKFGFMLLDRVADGFASGIDMCKMRLEA
jgi:predicted GNAT family N-acyltransferase